MNETDIGISYHFNKPPPEMGVVAQQFKFHRPRAPKGKFRVEAIARTTAGWTACDLGEKGWYSPGAIPRSKPVGYWDGDLTFMLSQPLAYERTIETAIETLQALERITKVQAQRSLAWLKEERRLYNRQSEIRDALGLLKRNGYKVTEKKTRFYQRTSDSSVFVHELSLFNGDCWQSVLRDTSRFARRSNSLILVNDYDLSSDKFRELSAAEVKLLFPKLKRGVKAPADLD